MKTFKILTSKGYLCGFSESTFNIQQGCAYQNDGINKPEWSKDECLADEYCARSLSGIINSLTQIIKEDLIKIEFIKIEVHEN